MILVCSGPGVFAGDRLEQRVRVEPAHASCWSRRRRCRCIPAEAAGPAALDSWYDVEHDATLDCFWDPLIPFAGSRLQQRIDLRVAEGGQLFWSDALMSGRVGARRSVAIRVARPRAARERRRLVDLPGALRLAPTLARPGAPRGARRSAHYLGTTIVWSAAATAARAEEAQRRLATIDGLRAGVDCPSPTSSCGRLLAARGPRFASAARRVARGLGRPASLHCPWCTTSVSGDTQIPTFLTDLLTTSRFRGGQSPLDGARL